MKNDLVSDNNGNTTRNNKKMLTLSVGDNIPRFSISFEQDIEN